jgi:hypothetical protein
MVNGFADAARTIAEADPANKAELYVALRVTVTYDPARRTVRESL